MIHVNFLHRIFSAVAQITSAKNLHVCSLSSSNFIFFGLHHGWCLSKNSFFTFFGHKNFFFFFSPRLEPPQLMKTFRHPLPARFGESLNFDRHVFLFFVYFIDNIARLSSCLRMKTKITNYCLFWFLCGDDDHQRNWNEAQKFRSGFFVV